MHPIILCEKLWARTQYSYSLKTQKQWLFSWQFYTVFNKKHHPVVNVWFNFIYFLVHFLCLSYIFKVTCLKLSFLWSMNPFMWNCYSPPYQGNHLTLCSLCICKVYFNAWQDCALLFLSILFFCYTGVACLMATCIFFVFYFMYRHSFCTHSTVRLLSVTRLAGASKCRNRK